MFTLKPLLTAACPCDEVNESLEMFHNLSNFFSINMKKQGTYQDDYFSNNNPKIMFVLAFGRFKIGTTGEREAELRTILYLRGLISCSFSINSLIIITQACLNLVFNS